MHGRFFKRTERSAFSTSQLTFFCLFPLGSVCYATGCCRTTCTHLHFECTGANGLQSDVNTTINEKSKLIKYGNGHGYEGRAREAGAADLKNGTHTHTAKKKTISLGAPEGHFLSPVCALAEVDFSVAKALFLPLFICVAVCCHCITASP